MKSIHRRLDYERLRYEESDYLEGLLYQRGPSYAYCTSAGVGQELKVGTEGDLEGQQDQDEVNRRAAAVFEFQSWWITWKWYVEVAGELHIDIANGIDGRWGE